MGDDDLDLIHGDQYPERTGGVAGFITCARAADRAPLSAASGTTPITDAGAEAELQPSRCSCAGAGLCSF
jgi:hypothetical protein